MNIVELKKVSYCYPGTNKTVLKDVSLQFQAGKVYGIIGKSGTGKSTLLSLMAGLQTCKIGEVTYQGNNLSELDLDEYRAKEIGSVFQGYNLLHTATALENVILTLEISGFKGKKKKRAYELLESVGIDYETANRKVLKLSGGEQQRVGIACAISNDPKVIFADEPTGNLDAETENIILALFHQIAKVQNRCVVIVTHSKAVEKHVDQLFGISGGHVNCIL